MLLNNKKKLLWSDQKDEGGKVGTQRMSFNVKFEFKLISLNDSCVLAKRCNKMQITQSGLQIGQ